MTDHCTIYVTCANETEARVIARGLVERKLAACVTIIPTIHSIYEWEGALCESTEVALLIKSRGELSNEAIDFIRQNHSYDCPCIVQWPIISGHHPFLKWIDTQTSR